MEKKQMRSLPHTTHTYQYTPKDYIYTLHIRRVKREQNKQAHTQNIYS